MTFHRFSYGAAAAAALLAAGCSTGASGPSSLAVTTALSAGDSRCPNGGARIDTGVDDGSGGAVAGNGVLEAGEIRSTQYVCVPSTAATSLVKTTPVAAGDSNCPAGGIRIDSGLDDGSGGGVAADGILEPGEVTSTAYSCKGPVLHIGSYDPPAGADGPFRIYTRGGDASTEVGSASVGGNGGQFETYLGYGSAGGHVKLFRTGLVDASFTLPARPDLDFGPGLLEVPASSTVHVRPVTAPSATTDLGGQALADGDVVCAGGTLYVWHGTTSYGVVSGVHVAAGGTLALDHVDGAPTPRMFSVEYAFFNEGTIVAGRDAAGNADGLTMQVGSFWSEPGSRIDLSGAAQPAGTAGGNGGSLDLTADSAGYQSFGGLVNQGTVDTSGGAGDDGGDAGDLRLWSNNVMYNTGAAFARGGDAVTRDYAVRATSGGTGGGIDLEAGSGSLFNSGDVDASGGNGSQNGGDAGSMTLYGGRYGVGHLYNTGALTAKGGDADPSCTDGSCQGGYGGSYDLEAYYGGDLLSSGSITSAGGDGRSGKGGGGHPASSTGCGGNGSYCYGIFLGAWTGYNHDTVESYYDVLGGTVMVSGNLDSHGGHGEVQGGAGGAIEAYSDPEDVPMGQEVVLLGYGGGVNTSGGAGDARGGDAGWAWLYQESCGYSEYGCAWPTGSVINYADFTCRGGEAVSGRGGDGGDTGLWTYPQSYAVGSYGSEQAINHGRIDATGGSGGTLGGSAGFIRLYGIDGVTNSADLVTAGGDATAPGGTGGSNEAYGTGPYIFLGSDRGIGTINSGALSNDGGDSTADTGAGTGGASGGVQLEGPTVTNSGTLCANGGSANLTAGTGGAGGDVLLQSVQGVTANTADSTASGGAGATAGASGHVVVDGQMIR